MNVLQSRIEVLGAEVGVDDARIVTVSITEPNLERTHIAAIDEAVWDFAGTVPPDVIIDARQVRHASSDARLRASQANPYNRLAIIVSSPVTVMVSHFFVRVAGLPHPARLFRDVDKAHAWLLSFR